MSPARSKTGRLTGLWAFLSLDKLMAASMIHLVYWAGLGIILLGGFGVVGGAVGVALREGQIMGWLLALPVLAGGLLVVAAFAIIWRSFCEFYVVVFQIGEDLRAMRSTLDADTVREVRPEVRDARGQILP